MRNGVAALASGLLLSACSVVGVRTVEEPPFKVLGDVGGHVGGDVGTVQIRSYGPRLAAEAVVDGGEIDARSKGFQLLAGYIFGGNSARTSIAMTAPVAQSSQTIAMTAPVDQARDANGQWRIRFYMPAKYTRDTLPTPTNPAVQIVEAPAQTVAVLRYSGIPTKEAVRDADARLLTALSGSAWRPVGAPFAWFYDPPWTIPPLRRNEAVVAVEHG